MRPVERRHERHAQAAQLGKLDEELAEAPDEHADAEGQDGRAHPRAEPEHGADHRDVQDGRGERGGEEAVMRVQHAHRQRGEPHEEQVRETSGG